MVVERRNEEVNLKSLKTGRARKWDARLTPEDTVALWEQEKKKAPWIVHVAVLESGDILSGTTPPEAAEKLFAEHPCVGFVGGLRIEGGAGVQFFTKQLRVSRGAGDLLNSVVQRLGGMLEQTLPEQVQLIARPFGGRPFTVRLGKKQDKHDK